MGHKLTWRWSEQSVLPAGECRLPHACATAACPGTGSPCSAWLHWQELNPHVNQDQWTLHQDMSWMQAHSGTRHLHCCVLPSNGLTLLALASLQQPFSDACLNATLEASHPKRGKYRCCCAVKSGGGGGLQTRQTGTCSFLRSCGERGRATRRV